MYNLVREYKYYVEKFNFKWYTKIGRKLNIKTRNRAINMNYYGGRKMNKPNIIFYFTDQQRFDTCGCYGQKLDITPNLDKLAQEGTVFKHAFTAQPVCGPCRALFQTGQYPTETGCFRNNIALPLDVKTVANYIEDGGYQTAYVGKWHLASNDDPTVSPISNYEQQPVPLERRGGYTGYWRAADILEFTSHGYGGHVWNNDMEEVSFENYRADAMTDLAIEFLDTNKSDKPFFMTISQIEPHHQNDRKHYEGPNGSKERFKDYELPADLANFEGDYRAEYPDYLGCCKSLDDNLGRLVEKLKELEIYDNTVIIFSADHGSHFKTRNKENVIGGDDYKRTGHDGALRIPLVISGGKFKGGKIIDELVSTESLPKTILAIAGIDVDDKMIGEDLQGVAKKVETNHEKVVFAQISESKVGRVIRTEQFKLGVYALNLNGSDVKNSSEYVVDYMYDLRKDPHELTNINTDSSYDVVKTELARTLETLILEKEGIVSKIIL